MIVTHQHLKQDYAHDAQPENTPFLNASHDISPPTPDAKPIVTENDGQHMRAPSGESTLFLKQWLKNPTRLGTCAPISNRVATKAARCIDAPHNKRIVEIGSGPGRLTRALLQAGVEPDNFKALELDPELCAYARQSLPHIDFIEGDAASLPLLLPKDWIKKVDIVFSTIPFMYMPEHKRTDITNAVFNVLKPGGEFFHLTYHWGNPLKHMMLDASCVASVWLNMPPAFIWRYRYPALISNAASTLRNPHLQPVP